MHITWLQVTAVELAQYCFETVIKSDWVQSQELSVLLLARMVFHHHSLPREYLDREEVVHMLVQPVYLPAMFDPGAWAALATLALVWMASAALCVGAGLLLEVRRGWLP